MGGLVFVCELVKLGSSMCGEQCGLQCTHLQSDWSCVYIILLYVLTFSGLE